MLHHHQQVSFDFEAGKSREPPATAMQRSYSDIMIQSDRGVVGSTPPKKEWCQRFTSFRQKPGRGAKDPVGHAIFFPARAKLIYSDED